MIRPEIKVGDTKKAPKPLLADAKVGDLCKRRDGKWVQIDSVSNDRPLPIMCKSDIGGMDCYDYCGNNQNAHVGEKDIIEHQPLAKEGTKEWGEQMLMLGKDVCDDTAYYHAHPDGSVGAFLIGRPIGNGSFISQIKGSLHDVNWRLYEPKPKFEVGQFVECVGQDCPDYGYVEEFYSSGGLYKVASVVEPGTSFFEKPENINPLPAKNVVLNFGNGIKGKIAPNNQCPEHHDICHVVVQDEVTGYWSSIYAKMLTEPMRSIVESVLARQEVEK
jgi:hypothetical protein